MIRWNHTGKPFCERMVNISHECRIEIVFYIAFRVLLFVVSDIVRNGLIALNDG
jgi:hypothetical protein